MAAQTRVVIYKCPECKCVARTATLDDEGKPSVEKQTDVPRCNLHGDEGGTRMMLVSEKISNCEVDDSGKLKTF